MRSPCIPWLLVFACTLGLGLAGCSSSSDNSSAPGPIQDASTLPDSSAAEASLEASSQEKDATEEPAESRPDSGPKDSAPQVDSPSEEPPSCQATICLAGAVGLEDGGNPWLGEICAQAPGLVRDCRRDPCETRFDMFNTTAALEALVTALDSNNDGTIDETDEPCRVNIVGYSWGGMNAIDLAERYLSDSRVAENRKQIDKLITIDPFKPMVGETYAVPEKVSHFWSYRHSLTPSDDCSLSAPLGPYKGLLPLCYSESTCVDYDYSLSPTTHFAGMHQVWTGADIGHCSVVDAASLAVLHNLETGQDFSAVPQTVPVGSP